MRVVPNGVVDGIRSVAKRRAAAQGANVLPRSVRRRERSQMSECQGSEPYALQVLGDSMEPEFPDQCIVVLQAMNAVRSGAYVFAEVEGVRWFRQYVKDDDGREWLVALNDLYPEIDLTGLDWRVLGVIVQRNVRRQIKHYDNF
jgi:phage repressor protein C with HTH and peptisase S24 domain